MKPEEITRLASLARINITDAQRATLAIELADIMDYVAVVSDIASDNDGEPALGARYNIMREDVTTNVPNQFTDDALREMPHTNGRHLLVKKIMKAK